MAEPDRFGPPPEVVAYFGDKGLKPAFSWLDVWGTEHAHAFTVAKATELELLAVFQDSIATAIDKGQGFETWQSGIRGELARIGWLGPRMVADPDGLDDARLVDFSSSRRLKTIFWGNVSSARAAGQWQRAQRSKKVLPYLLYVRTAATDPRPEHLAFVGVILPVDHPWWDAHFPPNGWLCKCRVRQISAREAERLLGRAPEGGGLIYRAEPPDLGPPVPHRNRRTGEVTEIPVGIDPGWHTNPGKARATTLIDHLESRLAVAPEKAATEALEKLWEDPFVRVLPRLPDQHWLPAGVSPALQAELGAKSPVISVPKSVIAERLGKHRMSVQDFAVLPSLIAEATALPDPRGAARTRALHGKRGKAFWRAFVTVSETGYMRVSSLHQRARAMVAAAFEAAGLTMPDDD